MDAIGTDWKLISLIYKIYTIPIKLVVDRDKPVNLVMDWVWLRVTKLSDYFRSAFQDQGLR
mgnify:CR=1 FL=1